MSKIGKKPVEILPETQVTLEENTLKVIGSLGEISVVLPNGIKAVVFEKEVRLQRESEEKKIKSLHGTYARLLKNAIIGVSSGFEKNLEIVGTGYRGNIEGDTLVLSLGFSHQIKFPIPEGVKITVQENNKIKVFGIDKEKVGTVSHNIKMFRKPDAYKGKGIRYLGEKLKLKPGKAAAKIGGAVK